MDPPNLLRLRYTLETGIQRSFPAQRFLTPHEIFLRMNLPGSLSQAWDHRVGLLNLHEPYQGRGLWLQPHRAGNDHDPAAAGRSASGGHGNTFAGPHCDDTSAQGNRVQEHQQGLDQSASLPFTRDAVAYRLVRTRYTWHAQRPQDTTVTQSFVSPRALTPCELYRQMNFPGVLGCAWDSRGQWPRTLAAAARSCCILLCTDTVAACQWRRPVVLSLLHLPHQSSQIPCCGPCVRMRPD